MQSLTVGTIGNVTIKLHPTLALVPAWVVIDQLSNGTFGAASLLYGVGLIVILFSCVLLHEMGHAMLAAGYGIKVRDVTLSVIGGIAVLDSMPVRPRREAAIALAGPAVNLAIFVTLLPIFLLAAVISGVDGLRGFGGLLVEPSLLGLFASVLAANLLLIVFNLLPIFPMDGGRVLRALLSAQAGRELGTRIAVVVGQVLAVALALFGILVLQNPTLVLLAVFIVVFGYAEGRSVRVEAALRRMRVGQYALWDQGGITPGERLTNALLGGPRDLVVTQDGRVVGMLWRNAVLSSLNGGLSSQTVGDVMDREVIAVDINDSVFDAQLVMHEFGRWAVPVLENGTYRGIFTADRLLHLYRQLTPPPVDPKYVAGFVTAASSLSRLLSR